MSTAAREIEADIAIAASSGARVLISGEPGAGKETVARAIHERSCGPRAPFVALCCADAPGSTLAAELFGGSPRPGDGCAPFGAFDRAAGGTLFLGRIEEADPGTQQQLVQVIEGRSATRGDHRVGTPGARLIAACDSPLFDRVARGQFAEELFYQLNLVHIVVPPLRDRKEDLPTLITDALEREAAEARVPLPTLTVEAWQDLCEYEWPGNLAEVRWVARTLTTRARRGCIGRHELPIAGSPADRLSPRHSA